MKTMGNFHWKMRFEIVGQWIILYRWR